jgi:phosphate-selective porin OprO/OprP
MNTDLPRGRVGACLVLAVAFVLAAGPIRGQDATSKPAGKQPMFDDSIDAAEAEEGIRRFTKFNSYEGPYATLKFGFNAMYDVAGYSQDDNSKTQVGDLSANGKWRDFRFVLAGTFPKVPWITWKTGVMWDGANEKWLVRETGVIVAVPRLYGHLFIGRTKEGFSMVKHMVGTSIWGLERNPFLDGAIPIMADGVRWMGYGPKGHFVWNLGFFNEKYSQSAHSPYYDRQAVARIAWLPYAVPETDTLVHVGLNLRYADPQDGKLTFKARPEATTAPYFIDTGSFPAKRTTTIGPELYYRRGSLIVGSEYYFMKVDSAETHDPVFHGGDVTAVWAVTGETRSYSTRGGVFGFLNPNTSVFSGGRGAWEAMLRLSFTDATAGTLEGGKLWRVSPIIGWYLNENLHLVAGYGYAGLDKLGIDGKTQFLQARIHVQF